MKGDATTCAFTAGHGLRRCAITTSAGPLYRLGPVADEQPSPELLAKIADVIVGRRPRASYIPAGYTYLGQFIDHDLSFVSRGLPDPSDPTEDISTLSSMRSPLLDLDSVFGVHGSLSEPGQTFQNLKVTEEVTGTTGEPSISDLPRDSDGRAIIPDERNDENLIVSQLHVAFINFYNRIESEFRQVGKSSEESSTEARAQTVRAFHRVVLEDFLGRLCMPEINQLDWNQAWAHQLFQPGRLPIEFVGAAFRFGHSMVLRSYRLRSQVRAPLSELLAHVDPQSGRVPAGRIPDWRLFFKSRVRPKGVQHASALAPSLAPGLREVPVDGHGPQNLAMLNLFRGSEWRLPSGNTLLQHLCDRLRALQAPREVIQCLRPLTQSAIEKSNPEASKLLSEGALTVNQLPLWYHFLLEAEISNREFSGNSPLSHGLGPLGSFVVIGTLRAAVRGSVWSGTFSDSDQDKFDGYIRKRAGFLEARRGARTGLGSRLPDRMSRFGSSLEFATMMDFIEFSQGLDRVFSRGKSNDKE